MCGMYGGPMKVGCAFVPWAHCPYQGTECLLCSFK